MSVSASPLSGGTGDLNPLLVDAKNIYTAQLAEAVGPCVLDAFDAMLDAVAAESSKHVQYRFQLKLREIPVWNADVVRQHTAAIEAKVPYLSELVAAAFVSYVKVMSSIKLRSGEQKHNIRLTLPTNDAFVHRVFINVARDLYAAPGTPPAAYDNMRGAVERAIRKMLPIKDILNAYLGSSVDDAHTVSPTLDDSDEDECPPCDAAEAEPPQASPYECAAPSPSPAPYAYAAEPAVAAEPAPAAPTLPAAPAVAVAACPAEGHETKTISIPPGKDGELFSDADDDDADWHQARR